MTDSYDDFDRLAGQPQDPVDGDEDFGVAHGGRSDTMNLGDVRLTGMSPYAPQSRGTSLVAWSLVVLLLLVLVLLVAVLVIPAQEQISAVEGKLTESRQQVSELQARVDSLESEQRDWLEARRQLTEENERLAQEIEDLHRAEDARRAEEERLSQAETRQRARRKATRRRPRRRR